MKNHTQSLTLKFENFIWEKHVKMEEILHTTLKEFFNSSLENPTY